MTKTKSNELTPSKVFFTRKISAEQLVAMFDKLPIELLGKVAVKTHSGEPGGHNYLQPALMKKLVERLQGTIVECNTAYQGQRSATVDHERVLEEHGFTAIAPVDIMDGEGELALPVKNGRHIKENWVGKNLANYQSMLILSHFKGHIMGGFGGALKNMSIGIASRGGKALLHSAGVTKDPVKCWEVETAQDDFIEAMAEAALAIVDFRPGQIAYINVMNNMSVDCDCSSNPEKPGMADVGILASLDPVALDKACLDLIEHSTDPGRDHFWERVTSRHGQHIIDYAAEIGVGNKDYELILVD